MLEYVQQRSYVRVQATKILHLTGFESEFCVCLFLSLGERVHSSKTSFKNGVASLSLTQCSPGDAGTYTCTAENTAGKQSSSAELHIIGKAGVMCHVRNFNKERSSTV